METDTLFDSLGSRINNRLNMHAYSSVCGQLPISIPSLCILGTNRSIGFSYPNATSW